MVIVIDAGRLALENWLDRWLDAGMPSRPRRLTPAEKAREEAAEARYDAMQEQRAADRDSLDDVPVEWAIA